MVRYKAHASSIRCLAVTLRAVVKQGSRDSPQAVRGQFFAPQIVADGIMAGGLLVFEMLGEVGASIVAR